MKLLGSAPTIDGTFVATDTTLEISALEIAGADGTLTADGTAGLDGTSLDLEPSRRRPRDRAAHGVSRRCGRRPTRRQAACHARATRFAAAFRGNGRPDSVSTRPNRPRHCSARPCMRAPREHSTAAASRSGSRRSRARRRGSRRAEISATPWTFSTVSNFRASRRWRRSPASIWRAARRSRATLRDR